MVLDLFSGRLERLATSSRARRRTGLQSEALDDLRDARLLQDRGGQWMLDDGVAACGQAKSAQRSTGTQQPFEAGGACPAKLQIYIRFRIVAR